MLLFQRRGRLGRNRDEHVFLHHRHFCGSSQYCQNMPFTFSVDCVSSSCCPLPPHCSYCSHAAKTDSGSSKLATISASWFSLSLLVLLLPRRSSICLLLLVVVSSSPSSIMMLCSALNHNQGSAFHQLQWRTAVSASGSRCVSLSHPHLTSIHGKVLGVEWTIPV